MRRHPGIASCVLVISCLGLTHCQKEPESLPRSDAQAAMSCTVVRSGQAILCMEYTKKEGPTYAVLKQECEGMALSGHTWSDEPCPASARIGQCQVASNATRPADSTHYFFGPAFDASTAEEMCLAGNGRFSLITNPK